ncbi:hypothetical protein ACFVXG_13420 [Kitasatospora sp. NPDC058162]|uniref:hypothetical protein n=1 Tax=Kitasatospora sp. NPDC058162 TaxID=3346362 RepID=UPI0036DBFDBB
MNVPLVRDPLNPRVPWPTDLLLGLITVVALVPVLVLCAFVNLLICLSVHAGSTIGILILAAVMLPLPGWIIRTSWRIGYRFVPVLTGTAMTVLAVLAYLY